MKIKEIDRTANVAWSPAEVDPIYMAVGTAAQQLDTSLNTNSTLEIYQFDINEGGLDLPVRATLPCENRFHKLIWGSKGTSGDGEKEHPSGIIVGGCDNGIMQVYDAAKILKNETPLVLTKTKHTGAVRALDFNPFRSHLVASGASESEIFIWDLTNPKTPMTPGTKVQPADDVSHLAWNKQVEHILASTFSTRCVVWDLRKNEPVIKVSDTTSRIRYKVVEWHPEVATQMCLASEDDSSPVIQLWDLRYATSPLKVIQGHQRGILGMAWCPQDPDLLLTCGKDARILCWNPNYPHPGYEMLCDIPTSSQFSFDVSFCPKNPIVIASSSYDGRVSIFGLSGGVQHPVTSSKLADSFPGMDLSMSHTPLPSQQPALLQLRDAPKWLKRPCGASFAFGGKLISFHNVKSAPVHQGQTHVVSGVVEISQLVTLPNLIERSKKLEETLQMGSLESYCSQKATGAGDTNESRIWEFLQASFSQNPRQLYVSMLGFNTTEMLAKLNKFSTDNDMDLLADGLQSLGRGAPDGYENGFDFPSPKQEKEAMPEAELLVPTNDNSFDGKINQALLCGSIDVAVNLCLEDERWADALLLATKGSPELLIKAQNKYFQKNQNEATQLIKAVVSHDLTHLVERCKLESWKQVLAVILTYADQNEYPVLADMLGKRLQKSEQDKLKIGALLCCICSGNMNHLVDTWVGDTNKTGKDSPEELQDLVEQVMILKKAGEHWGRDTNIDGGALASKLVQYSSLLASQGCLEAALNFLGDSNDPSISILRERLYYTLRYTSPTKANLQPRSRQTSESSSGMRSNLIKRPSYPNASNIKRGSSDFMNSTDFSNLTGPVHPPAPIPYGAPSSQNPYGNVYVNSNTSNSVGQYSPQFSTGSPGSYAPVGLPPRPPSTAPASIYNPTEVPVNSNRQAASGESPPTRTPLGSSLPHPPVSSAAHGWNDPPPIKSSNKPKVSATTANSVQPINYPIFTPESVTPNPMAMGPPRPMDPYGSSNNMYQGQNIQSPPSMMPPPPMQASQPFYNPSISTPSYVQSPTPVNAPPSIQPQQNLYGPSPTSNNFYAPPPQLGSSSQPVNQPYATGPPMSQSPWGAPPPGVNSYQPPQQAFAPTPLAPMQNPLLPPQSGAHMMQPVSIVDASPAISATPPPFAPNPSSMFQPITPAAQQQVQPKPVVAEPEPPKPRGPIPSEHATLIETLEKLRGECYEVAHLQQMKRKLEDVARKLEIFSDKLRDGSLSESTLNTLHNLVEAVRVHDYQQALSIHTQLVTAGNFAEISTFLPAVKVLIQSATQLGV